MARCARRSLLVAARAANPWPASRARPLRSMPPTGTPTPRSWSSTPPPTHLLSPRGACSQPAASEALHPNPRCTPASEVHPHHQAPPPPPTRPTRPFLSARLSARSSAARVSDLRVALTLPLAAGETEDTPPRLSRRQRTAAARARQATEDAWAAPVRLLGSAFEASPKPSHALRFSRVRQSLGRGPPRKTWGKGPPRSSCAAKMNVTQQKKIRAKGAHAWARAAVACVRKRSRRCAAGAGPLVLEV